jgi:hypothetical protein
MAAYTDFSFMRPGNGDGEGEEPKNKKPLSENEKIALAQKERESMLEYMRHPSYKERLKMELFQGGFNPSKKSHQRTLDSEYDRRVKEITTVPIVQSDELNTFLGEYVPNSSAKERYFVSPEAREQVNRGGSAIYVTNNSKNVSENPLLYSQVVGHELGHASHFGNPGGAVNFRDFFVKRPKQSFVEKELISHQNNPRIEQKEAISDMMSPYFQYWDKGSKKITTELATKRIGPEKVQMIMDMTKKLADERNALIKKHKREYDPMVHGPSTPKEFKEIMNKPMFQYLSNNPTEVQTQLFNIRKLAADKFGHNMSEDFDIKKYKDQIQKYYNENGLLDEYKNLSEDLELSDDQMNEMLKYIAKAKGEPSVSRYTA